MANHGNGAPVMVDVREIVEFLLAQSEGVKSRQVCAGLATAAVMVEEHWLPKSVSDVATDRRDPAPLG